MRREIDASLAKGASAAAQSTGTGRLALRLTGIFALFYAPLLVRLALRAAHPVLDAPDDELIFDSTRTGRKRRQLMVCFEQAVKEPGIGDFHFHDLRHTFATRLRAANVHEYDIADLLGHSTTPGETRSTKVTRGYAHGVPQRLRDAVDSLEEGKRLISTTPTLRQVARGV